MNRRHTRTQRRVPTVVLIAGLFLAGCGGGSTAPEAALASTPRAEPGTPSAPTPVSQTEASTSPTEARTSTTNSTATDPSGSEPDRVPTTEVGRATLGSGDVGSDVAALQRELNALSYWAGEVDGRFGESTRHAVVAFQKVSGLSADGIATAKLRTQLIEATRPEARSTSGRVVEVDLDRQVVLVVTDGTVDIVLDTSTGLQAGTTPVGKWVVERQIDGMRNAPLGRLYRPKYFHNGVAFHGYTSVPNTPASHGCVRLTYPAIDMLWEQDLGPLGTPVWVY